MTFWLGVAVAYTLIITIGIALGHTIAHRHPRGDGGGGSGWEMPDGWTPDPDGGATVDELEHMFSL